VRAVNLIPADEREGAGIGAGRSQGVAYAILVLLAGVALLAFLYGRANHQVSSRRSEAATLRAQAQRAQEQASRLAPYTSFVQMREARVQAVSTLVDSRFDWAHVMHEFGRVLPTDVYVSSLTGAVGSSTGSTSSSSPSASASSGSSVSSATPPGSVPTFDLAGCATSQREVALMLERLRLMDGVSSVSLQSSTKAVGAGGGAAGSCGKNGVQFEATVDFEPLPTQAATQAAVAKDASLGSAAQAKSSGAAK
jgi:Tfp pilus assembly protein PilN